MDAPKYFSLASSSQHILHSSKQQNLPLGETLRTSFFEESRATKTSFSIPELQPAAANSDGMLVHHCLDADVASETSIVIISCWMKTHVHPNIVVG